MSSEEKFKNVSIESDTKIHAIKYLNLDGMDCRYEFWGWGGSRKFDYLHPGSEESFGRVFSEIDWID